MIVADANLIAAYSIEGDGTAVAKAVFDKDRSWIAPKLWQAEFISVMLKFRRASRLTDDDALSAIYLARSLMSHSDYDSNLHDVFAATERTKCSAYDSCYVALAEEHRVRLVTTDGGILANAKHIALSPEQFLAA